MITKFSSLYAGHVDLGDLGQDATPANERRYSNEHLASVFEKTDALARTMDDLGYYALWLAEHHFQHEGYEVIPNILMHSVHLAHVTKRLRFGCGFNITPMWHPLRLAEDFAVADILTGGRVIFGVGRGYHTREVETLGGPMLDAEANREVFEEQVDIVMKAFHQESFSHHGKHYTLPPAVPYRGYELSRLTLVPRPLRRPVECWQPIVSASARGLDFMIKHRIKGVIGGGAATMAEKPILAYREAAARAGVDLAPGQDLCIGIFFHLAESRERAIREVTPFYEEHVKMFGPLGFVPGITPAQVQASSRRGGWGAAGVPTVADFARTGAWFCGPPEELVAYLKHLQGKYPGLEYANVSSSMGTPKAVMLEQLTWFGREVLPAFAAAPAR
ncbi:MAG TPA: LLM class flavin-dependent oxidoreductase [Methylomirabilota bacterium]|jgi:alkanesulfonate monooxygenase SsuD/methylene tetrahydromethanopterin reductase-like flavin-dependent oxidoreductase (luciferase family)